VIFSGLFVLHFWRDPFIEPSWVTYSFRDGFLANGVGKPEELAMRCHNDDNSATMLCSLTFTNPLYLRNRVVHFQQKYFALFKLRLFSSTFKCKKHH